LGLPLGALPLVERDRFFPLRGLDLDRECLEDLRKGSQGPDRWARVCAVGLRGSMQGSVHPHASPGTVLQQAGPIPRCNSCWNCATDRAPSGQPSLASTRQKVNCRAYLDVRVRLLRLEATEACEDRDDALRPGSSRGGRLEDLHENGRAVTGLTQPLAPRCRGCAC
jgi:hypothetical protein